MSFGCITVLFFALWSVVSSQVGVDSIESPFLSNPIVSSETQAQFTLQDQNGAPNGEIGILYEVPGGVASEVFTTGAYYDNTEALWSSFFGPTQYPPTVYGPSFNPFPHKMIISERNINASKLIALFILPKRFSTRDISKWKMQTAFLRSLTIVNQASLNELNGNAPEDALVDTVLTMNYFVTSISSSATPPPFYAPFILYMKGTYSYVKGSKIYVLYDDKGNIWLMTASWQFIGTPLDNKFNELLTASTFPTGWSGEIITNLKERVDLEFNKTDGTHIALQDPVRNNFFLFNGQLPGKKSTSSSSSSSSEQGGGGGSSAHSSSSSYSSVHAEAVANDYLYAPPEVADILAKHFAKIKNHQNKDKYNGPDNTVKNYFVKDISTKGKEHDHDHDHWIQIESELKGLKVTNMLFFGMMVILSLTVIVIYCDIKGITKRHKTVISNNNKSYHEVDVESTGISENDAN